MRLIHTCPICNKNYERDCTPEPDLPCNGCIDNMKYLDYTYLLERLRIGL